MNFKDLVESHPEVMRDRYTLGFSERRRPAEIADAFSRFGVVMLKDALPPAMLQSCAEAFRRFVQQFAAKPSRPPDQSPTPEADKGDTDSGSWHSPWVLRDGGYFPAAVVISAIIRSWTWDVVEEICGSSHIVIVLKWCTARHSVDKLLGVGAHQDARVVAGNVPFAIWIPFQQIMPRVNSGLGFVVPAPDHLLPTLPHDDVGPEYILSDPARLWIPPYAARDLTIHSKFSPHFTTGYGTLSDRFSLEIRAMPRNAAPQNDLDPAIYVSRRNGVPTIVEMQGSAEIGVQDFFASADLSSAACKNLRKVLI